MIRPVIEPAAAASLGNLETRFIALERGLTGAWVAWLDVNAVPHVEQGRTRVRSLPVWARPLAVAVPYFAIVPPLAALAAGAEILSAGLALALAASTSAAGIGRAALEWLRIARERALADAWIRTHAIGAPPSRLVEARMERHVRPKNRLMLAGSLRRAVVSARKPRALTNASVLDVEGVRAHADLIEKLAARLADTERSVAAQGIVLTNDLLTDGCTSPLYFRRHGDLGKTLLRALEGLETR
jgi:hypothetical protein